MVVYFSVKLKKFNLRQIKLKQSMILNEVSTSADFLVLRVSQPI